MRGLGSLHASRYGAALHPSRGPLGIPSTVRLMPQKQLHGVKLREHPLYLEMLERRRLATELNERARRREFLLYLLSFTFWTLLGVAIAGWGMHTTRVAYSRAAIEVGVLLGNAGILLTLLVAYRRSE